MNSKAFFIVLFAVGGVVSSVQAADTTYTWAGTISSAWATGGNWQGGTAPSTGGSYTERISVGNGTYLNPTTLIYDASLGDTILAPTGTFAMVLGSGGTGSLSVTGGTLECRSSSGVIVGNNISGGNGTLSIDGGTFINNSSLGGNGTVYLGASINAVGGVGAFTLNSGIANISTLAVGSNTGSSASVGTINLNGGTLSVGNLANYNGTATINFNGGLLSAQSNLTISGFTAVNVQSAGALINTAGSTTTTIKDALSAGAGGGGLTKYGMGTLVLSGANSYTGATLVSAGVLNIQSNTALGTSDSGATVANGATLQLQNGITVSGEALSLTGGGNGNMNGALESVSGNNTWTGAITVDSTTVNRITADSGVLTLSGNTTLTGAGEANQLVLQGNGTILILGDILSGAGNNNSTLTRSTNGTGTAIIAGNNTTNGITIITNGTLQIGNGGTTGTLGSGAVSNNASLVFNRSDAYTVSNIISGGGSVAQNGTGLLTLSGANTYTGATIVNAGTLALANTGSLTSSALTFGGSSTAAAVFDVSAKAANYTLATVSGVGTVQLASGASLILTGALNHTGADNLLVNGNLRLASSATNTFEIDLATDLHDYLDVAGTLNYNSSSLLIAFSNGKALNGTYTYDLLDFGAMGSGTLASVTFSGLTDGESAAYDATTGIVTLTVVPEPGALALLAGALVGLAAYAWRKRR